jgi:Uma2 family endonuclease
MIFEHAGSTQQSLPGGKGPIFMASPTFTAAPPAGIPALEPGDHLTRDEFERRYAAMPNVKKAELIEGVVYMPSPVRVGKHGVPHSDLNTWLGHYRAFTRGVCVSDNTTVRLDLDNEVQPDGLMYVEPTHGGRVRISTDDYIEGSPELVAEIAASTASFDLHTKLHVYRRNQVQEYVVWRVLDKAIDWFAWRAGAFNPLALNAAGFYQSEVFPGLWLDPAALIRADLVAV